MTKALVLGGGGLAGIAWELGMLAGLADAGVDVTDAAVVVGTSAGSAVGAQITSGVELGALYAAQLDPPEGGAERAVDFDIAALTAVFTEAGSDTRDRREVRARIGGIALGAHTISEAERLEIIRSRLPSKDWPDRRLLITAVDAASGDWLAFDRSSGVDLVDAVAASCAVPGVWPPATINGRRYIDGGMRSITNADLAAGCDQILILCPMTPPASGAFVGLEEEVGPLRSTSRVVVIEGDDTFKAAAGLNPLDPATRRPCAKAGYESAARWVDEVRNLWTA